MFQDEPKTSQSLLKYNHCRWSGIPHIACKLSICKGMLTEQGSIPTRINESCCHDLQQTFGSYPHCEFFIQQGYQRSASWLCTIDDNFSPTDKTVLSQKVQQLLLQVAAKPISNDICLPASWIGSPRFAKEDVMVSADFLRCFGVRVMMVHKSKKPAWSKLLYNLKGQLQVKDVHELNAHTAATILSCHNTYSLAGLQCIVAKAHALC